MNLANESGKLGNWGVLRVWVVWGLEVSLAMDSELFEVVLFAFLQRATASVRPNHDFWYESAEALLDAVADAMVHLASAHIVKTKDSATDVD